MSNFPPGAANDPRAPYNQKDIEPLDWESSGEKDECHNCGSYRFVDSVNRCEECYYLEPDYPKGTENEYK